ncbi:MAG: 16S rRNA (guanine(527)-N(7))-methyltransferase RsmG, partial [Planctomycetota bacterium]
MPLDPAFQSVLEQHSYELPDDVAEKLQTYAKLMWEWNEKLNLTRHTTWELFVARDLRDCLQLAPLLAEGEEVLDLGSGNGVPGIPLAILRPDIDVSLAESVAKRANVLNEIISELDLPVAVYAARGEDLLDDFRFSSLVCRAVGSIAKLCRWVENHWSNIDRMLLIKGPKWIEERGEARHLGLMGSLQLRRIASYPLGDGAEQGSAEEEDQGAIIQIWPQG